MLASSSLGVAGAVVVGGAMISVFEGVRYLDGAWIAFSVVSTTGFGQGPQCVLGCLIAMGVFAFAALCRFAVLVTAIELGLARFQDSALVDEALRPLARRRGAWFPRQLKGVRN